MKPVHVMDHAELVGGRAAPEKSNYSFAYTGLHGRNYIKVYVYRWGYTTADALLRRTGGCSLFSTVAVAFLRLYILPG